MIFKLLKGCQKKKKKKTSCRKRRIGEIKEDAKEDMTETICGLQRIKYLLSELSQKKFSNP